MPQATAIAEFSVPVPVTRPPQPGRAPAVNARLPADVRAVRKGLALAWAFADDAAIGDAASDRLAIVVEEWLMNVVEHGTPEARTRIALRLERRTNLVQVTFTDAGGAFDPRPVTFEGPNAERGGGVGLAMIKEWCRIAAYSRRAGRNRLVLELPLGDAP